MDPSADRPLFVRLAAPQAQRLDAAAARAGLTKRRLVEDAIREHLDSGLAVGRIALREDAPPVLTLDEAAAFLRVDAAALREEAEAGRLPGRRVAGEWRFSRAALADWLQGSQA